MTRERSDTTQRPRTAQDEFEAFRQQAQAGFDGFKKKAEEDYEDFRNEANRRYAEFLKEAWEQFQVLPAIPKPKEDEVPPVVMPEEDKQKPIEDVPVPIEEDIVLPPAPEPQPVPVAPIKEEPVPQEQYVSFTLYGTPMKVRFSDAQRFTLTSCDEATVAEVWKRLSEVAYNNTIRDCMELRITRQLSDWAYLQMLHRMAEGCLGKTNEATLLMAYVYCQSGYQMRLGMAEGRLLMLYASRHAIYDHAYFKIDGSNYYVYGSDEQRLHISQATFPQEKPMSLLVPQEQHFDVAESSLRQLASRDYKDITVTVSVNKNLIDFYNSYPTSMTDGNFMTRWAMYANTPMDEAVKRSLYPTLKKKLAGLGQKEAMERLLNWVQTAFEYEYDDKVWGHDRAFFAEESLFYPYCDCEDRSILLSRLVRDLLGLRCILVFYPGHLAMAVHFTDNVKGDYIMLNGEKFVVCDPTYIGASVGRTMPKMDNQTAKVILLEPFR